VMRPRLLTRIVAVATAILAVSAIVGAVVPSDAQAIDLTPDIGIPNPFDVGLPGPSDLVKKVFEVFFKTFFGIEAKVTRRAVEWLVATPIYTDPGQYAQLNELRGYVSVAAWALFTLVFTVSAVRYYASGFTSGGSYEAFEAVTRAGLAAGALVIYPELFGSLSIAMNHLTYGLTHAPSVEPGLTKLLEAATVANFTNLGIGSIVSVLAVVMLVLLIVSKIVIATVLALLYVSGSLAIALWPLPEMSWMARTWLQSLIGALLWPVIWALCFALFAVMGASSFTFDGSFGAELVKPWVAVAALFVAFKAPQLLARQAMLAGLMPSPGNAAARGLVYGRAALRAGGGAARGAEGVSGRFGAAAGAGA
jgi:hypothetical protein